MKSDTDTSEPTGKHRAAWWGVAAFCILLVLYPLSIGPAAVLHARGYLPSEAEIFYAPLIYASGLTGTKGLLEAYVIWWVVATGSRGG